MLTFIDNFLNRVTMYRLVLYHLLVLTVAAALLSFVGVLGYSGWLILFSACFLTLVCYLTNELFAKVFSVPANTESVFITALILLFLIMPPDSLLDTSYLALAFWASVIGIASKYIIVIKKKHIFNPAALGVAATFFTLGLSASWWVGTAALLPVTAIGGFLIVRKIKRSDLVFAFLLTAPLTLIALKLGSTLGPVELLERAFLDTSLIFFATVMLTEPLTMPPTEKLQMVYGAMTGFLFAGINLGPVHFTPELALLAGNIFAYIVSPKQRLLLRLKEKKETAKGIYDFLFDAGEKFSFTAGQYLEWTLAHDPVDSRGMRRYFTLASSPTEKDICLGVKFYDPPSSFKKAMLSLEPGQTVSASSLAGDFVLPKNRAEKLVFIAGGIGVTPFRSMIKYLSDTGEKRDIVLIYSAKTVGELAYTDVFAEAAAVGVKTHYVVGETGPETPPGTRVGLVDAEMIKSEVLDFAERVFYLSGPRGMVVAFDKALRGMGIPGRNIKIDYFPGFV